MNDNAAVLAFIREHVDAAADELASLGAGLFAQAYRFRTPQGLFVLRIGVSREAFGKDQLAFERLGSAVPVPRVLAIGSYDPTADGVPRFYCLTDWKPGRILTDLDAAATQALLPSLFDTLLTLSRVPVPDSTGFGILDGAGRARQSYATWSEYIGDIDAFPRTFTPRGQEVYRSWSALFTDTFLDKSLVQNARRRLMKLLPLLPNERHYVHGDFGFDNALAEHNHLTAVLDWAELRCGDWLYDLAYLAWHDPTRTDYIGAFAQFAADNGLQLPHFRERIQVYYGHIFLGNVFLESNRNMRDWYEEDVARYFVLLGF